MLKRRVIAVLVVRNGIVVQSIGFKKYLPVGKPSIAIEFLNQWGIDEIILLDISATKNKSHPDYEMISAASRKGYVPLTVGGGITGVNHVKELMHCGADKIALNQSAIHNPRLIDEAAKVFGNQCVVVSVDAVKVNGQFRVYDYLKKIPLEITPDAFAKKAEELGAGEILINSVDKDGSYSGFDLDLINEVCSAVSIPVICCGGAKNANDFIEVFNKTKVSSAAAANFFNFTEHSVNTTKSNINKEINIRLETYADYKDAKFDNDLRLQKKSDDFLEDLLFIKIENEII